MLQMEVDPDPDSEQNPNGNDGRWPFVMSVIALVFSLVSLSISGYSLWLTHLQGPRLDVFLGENLLINGQPLIGMSCTFTNNGAQAKVVNHLLLELSGPNTTCANVFDVRSISPSLSSWIYDEKTGRLAEQTKVVHSPFDAFQVPGKGQTHETLWFLPSDLHFRFSEGEYGLVIKGYGESKDDLAFKKLFRFRIERDEYSILMHQPDQFCRVVLSPWR